MKAYDILYLVGCDVHCFEAKVDEQLVVRNDAAYWTTWRCGKYAGVAELADAQDLKNVARFVDSFA